MEMWERTKKTDVKEEVVHEDGEAVVPTRRLRPRKKVCYKYDALADDSDEENKASIEPVKKARKTSSSSSSDEDDDYEEMRLKNIRERMELVKSLGIVEIKEELGRPFKEKARKLCARTYITVKITPREKSRRLRAEAASFKHSGPLRMLSLKKVCESDDGAASKCADFLSLLRPFLSQGVGESELSTSTCSIDTFKKKISQLTLTKDMIVKTNRTRVVSLAIHPGEEKILVASGSTSGDLGLWDVYNPDKEKCVEILGPHTSDVVCTSFDRFDPCKIITTSSDDTVKRGDLLKLVFEEIWVHEQNSIGDVHTSWHDQVDANTILVAHGTGYITVMDFRKPLKPMYWYECHSNHGVSTVQHHPQDNNFFVTASRIGQVRIWDRRMMDRTQPEPIWDSVLQNSIKSAFFSCRGNLLLTTCRDGQLKIYTTACHQPGGGAVVADTNHNINAGRGVPRAMWHPQREDVYMVGGLQRKIQIHGIDGQPALNLTSEHLSSAPSVHVWHPTLPLIAGANISGNVHVLR